jgi:hypothetical protein
VAFVNRGTPSYPDDADGDALRRLAEHSDMSRLAKIDFMVAVSNEAAGRSIAALAELRGYRVTVERDAESSAWTCYCARTMLATYEGVVAAQAELDQLARSYGGQADGWGSFGNGFATLATDFAAALVRREFDGAHAMTSRSYRTQTSLEEMQGRSEAMTKPIEPLGQIHLINKREEWPAKRDGDVGWAHVAIDGTGDGGAVSVVVCLENGDLAIREVEWGRP